jgi:YVTN family beta-propeller protein
VLHIDPRTDVILATIPVGRDPGALAIADEDVWVANRADHSLSRIDVRANTVTATIPVAPAPIGVVTGEDAIWVASRGSVLLSGPGISRIDPTTNTVVETISLDDTNMIGFDGADDSLWVASHKPDAVLRIWPVRLGSTAANTGGPPRMPVAIGVGMLLLLIAAGSVHRRHAQRHDFGKRTNGTLTGLVVQLQARRRSNQLVNSGWFSRRTASAREAAGLAGAGLYVVGGWLVVSHLIVGDIGPIEQSTVEASPFTCNCAQTAPRAVRRAGELTLLIVSVLNGPTYHCWVPASVVPDDAIVETSTDFVGAPRALNCK